MDLVRALSPRVSGSHAVRWCGGRQERGVATGWTAKLARRVKGTRREVRPRRHGAETAKAGGPHGAGRRKRYGARLRRQLGWGFSGPSPGLDASQTFRPYAAPRKDSRAGSARGHSRARARRQRGGRGEPKSDAARTQRGTLAGRPFRPGSVKTTGSSPRLHGSRLQDPRSPNVERCPPFAPKLRTNRAYR